MGKKVQRIREKKAKGESSAMIHEKKEWFVVK